MGGWARSPTGSRGSCCTTCGPGEPGSTRSSGRTRASPSGACAQPPAGGEAVCETCGEAVRYRIMSAGSTVQRRRVWLVVSLAGLALGLASFVLLFWGIEGFEGWPVLGFAAGFGVLVGASVARVVEDGVRVGRRRGAHRHIGRSGAMNTERRERGKRGRGCRGDGLRARWQR